VGRAAHDEGDACFLADLGRRVDAVQRARGDRAFGLALDAPPELR
jgi:hypothetical protein